MSKTITIIGLGAGDIGQMPLGIYRKLTNTTFLYVRTKEHPVLKALEEEGVDYLSFDDVYEKHDQFEDVYQEIVTVLLEEATEKDIIYAVPGHPMVAERTVQLLIEEGKKGEYNISVEGGQSFIDPLFSALEIDPIEGFQFLDGLIIKQDDIQLNQHLIICQVYDQFIASNVKLTLMEILPDDYHVYIVTAVGSKEESIKKVPLFELDRDMELSNLTSVYVPPVQDDTLLYHTFSQLRSVIATLRGPNGCPWDQKQTHQTLKKFLLEEAYELLEAIDNEDDDHIIEELGDVLLQVMLHAQIGEDEGLFSIKDVISNLTEKLVRRHPHVFGTEVAQSEEEVVDIWKNAKKQEKTNETNSLLDSIPKNLPGLLKAYQIQKKAAEVGFDWDDVDPMWKKVKEEIEEFQLEIVKGIEGNSKAIEEFGDLLFAIVNVARYYKIDPEIAIAMTNNKFYRRFSYIEQEIIKRKQEFTSLTLEQLDQIWEEAKKQGL
ncbi:nucleoside triphosphate pyrophosphohydrolase [Bacillus timonensis]|nr:nucleoside triphosphate pyrophosphohydrolase [Bacillus timonensis]